MTKLGLRIKEARLDKGWNKTDLKREAGIKSASTITELENGTIEDSPQLPKLANALGVEIMWLQYGKGPKHRPVSQAASLSEEALSLAQAIDTMGREYIMAIKHLVTLDVEKRYGQSLSEIQTVGEDQRLSDPLPESLPGDRSDTSQPARRALPHQK